jgi:hypothetical protein
MCSEPRRRGRRHPEHGRGVHVLVVVYSYAPVTAPIRVVLGAGRMPSAPTEVVLAPQTAPAARVGGIHRHHDEDDGPEPAVQGFDALFAALRLPAWPGRQAARLRIAQVLRAE